MDSQLCLRLSYDLKEAGELEPKDGQLIACPHGALLTGEG